MPTRLHFDLNEVKHRRTKVRTSKTNGFVERFSGMVLNEFFRITMRDTFHECFKAVKTISMPSWLAKMPRERISAIATWAVSQSKSSCHS